jgi:hypothetical protein
VNNHFYFIISLIFSLFIILWKKKY